MTTEPREVGSWGTAIAVTAALSVVALLAGLNLPAEVLRQGHAALLTVAVFLTLVLAFSLLHLWRASGRAVASGARIPPAPPPPSTIAAALLVPFTAVELLTGVFAPAWVTGIRASAVVLAAFWVWQGVTGPEVDTALSPGWDLVRAVALLPVVAVGLLLLANVLPGAPTDLLSALVIAVAAVSIGWLLVTHAKPQSARADWFAGVAGGLLAVELTRWPSPLAVTPARFVTHAFLAAILLLAVIGTTRRLQHATHDIRDQRYLAFASGNGAGPSATTGSLERHDLRNAVSAVEAATRTLLDGKPTVSQGRRTELAAALQGELGRLQLMLAPPADDNATSGAHADQLIELGSVAREQAALTRVQGHRVEVDADVVLVRADPVALNRIVRNLLVNSARHGAGLDGTATIDICVEATADVASLTVRDRGPGVAAGAQAALFAPYEQGDPHAPGQGLGLASARTLALELGGDLTYLDEDAPGAAFRLRLPRATAAAVAPRGGAESGHADERAAAVDDRAHLADSAARAASAADRHRPTG